LARPLYKLGPMVKIQAKEKDNYYFYCPFDFFADPYYNTNAYETYTET